MLTMTGESYFVYSGRISFKKCSTPRDGMPMELSIPAGDSAVRGAGFPARAP